MKLKTITLTIKDAGEASLEQAAEELIKIIDDASVVTFSGELGAGKTTIISAICKKLGVDGVEISSPSFAIVNEYRSMASAELIYHFDLYRLKNLEELIDLGFEDYLDCGALCLIEWPRIAEDILPEDAVRIDIAVNEDKSRSLTISRPEEE